MGGIARVTQIQCCSLSSPLRSRVLQRRTITLQILLFAAAVVVTVAISTRTRAKAAPARRSAIASHLNWPRLIDQGRTLRDQFGPHLFS